MTYIRYTCIHVYSYTHSYIYVLNISKPLFEEGKCSHYFNCDYYFVQEDFAQLYLEPRVVPVQFASSWSLACWRRTRTRLSAAGKHLRSWGSQSPEPVSPLHQWSVHLKENIRISIRTCYIKSSSTKLHHLPRTGAVVVVVPTQPAPGHYGPWVSSGDALQNGCLVNIDGEVLRSWQDDWLFVDPGGCACSHDHNRDELWWNMIIKVFSIAFSCHIIELRVVSSLSSLKASARRVQPATV